MQLPPSCVILEVTLETKYGELEAPFSSLLTVQLERRRRDWFEINAKKFTLRYC